MYKAVIFDFDNTLINYTKCEQEALKHTLLQHGILQEEDAEWPRFQDIYNPINWSYWERRHHYSREQLTLYTFRDALQHYLGNSEAAESLADTYWEVFCNSCYFEPGAHEALKYVAQSYRVGMITNGYSDSQRKRLRACGVEQYFHSLVISDEVGVWKPDPDIFNVALEQLGHERNEVLFVGDSLTDDFKGAMNAGIDFCFYNRDGIRLDDHQPKFELKRLSQIKEIL